MLPAAIPVIFPVGPSIVAITVTEDCHVPPSTVDKKVVSPPIQAIGEPLNTPAIGGAETVTSAVEVTPLQPAAASTV